MKRAMARQAEAEREKRAKIINAEGESLAAAAQIVDVDKNTTVAFPAPLMTTIAELGSFLARERAAATPALPPTNGTPVPMTTANGTAGTA